MFDLEWSELRPTNGTLWFTRGQFLCFCFVVATFIKTTAPPKPLNLQYQASTLIRKYSQQK